MPLGSVREDGDRHQDGADRKLTGVEDRPGRHRELLQASLAAVDPSLLMTIDSQAGAVWTDGISLGFTPANGAEEVVRFLIAQAGDMEEAKTPSFRGEQEVLPPTLPMGAARVR